jgi:integrase/recombinase XerD
MIDKPSSPLRQRMIEDVTARRFTEKVQKDYLRHVVNFAAFLGRSPLAATAEDVRLFQLHMANRQIGAPTINAAISALRFFFNVTLERPESVRHLTSVHEPRKAPVVLNQEEVARLLWATDFMAAPVVVRDIARNHGCRISGPPRNINTKTGIICFRLVIAIFLAYRS